MLLSLSQLTVLTIPLKLSISDSLQPTKIRPLHTRSTSRGPARRPARRQEPGRRETRPAARKVAPRPGSLTVPSQAAQARWPLRVTPCRAQGIFRQDAHSPPASTASSRRQVPADLPQIQVAAASRRAALPQAESAERVDPPPSRAPSAGWTASYRGEEKEPEEERKWEGGDRQAGS